MYSSLTIVRTQLLLAHTGFWFTVSSHLTSLLWWRSIHTLVNQRYLVLTGYSRKQPLQASLQQQRLRTITVGDNCTYEHIGKATRPHFADKCCSMAVILAQHLSQTVLLAPQVVTYTHHQCCTTHITAKSGKSCAAYTDCKLPLSNSMSHTVASCTH